MKKVQKRNGETYAQALSREKAKKDLEIQLVVHSAEKRAIDTTLALTMIALNEAEGFGKKRLDKYLSTVRELSNEAMQIQHCDGRDVALTKIENRLKSIMGDSFNTAGLIDFDPRYTIKENDL